ncbi:beta-lactamase/transpeptidase-like protein [Aulographum hederae CBS 113979]|uniref:Beta-lactamase/transpeptidase-like protein n=1 Tax=Aulographum hederae CBS 113979 TaxID=1176131 RepID=A0A6G1HDM5_9PEZI|nr:beta-lactamase/transpeptidase-like protein [Aulographum hederae CBS 113979]
MPYTKATPNTVWQAGSTTKSFTALTLLKLMEESANTSTPLKLSTPISSIIRDDFVLPDEYSTFHVTFEDALSHRTGMPRHDLSYGGNGSSVREMVRNLRNLPITAPLRTKWQYCNMMYTAIAHAIESITGSWLGDVIKEKVLDPLQLRETFFDFDDAKKVEDAGRISIAHGYFWDNTSETYLPVRQFDTKMVTGAGGVISSVFDYSTYLRAMLEQPGGPKVASPETFKELRKPRIHAQTDTNKTKPYTGSRSYGLGWSVDIYRGWEVFHHNGGLPGFGAHMAYIPGLDWAIAIMGNAGISSNAVAEMIFYQLLDDILEVPAKDRYDVSARWDDIFSQISKNFENAREELFPDAPEPADKIEPALPLSEYTGTYSSKGYQSITLGLNNGTLYADVDRTLPHRLEFEHVSGEYFIAYMESPKGDPGILYKDAVRSEFVVGYTGKVQAIAVEYEPEMDNPIVFLRV